jgi:hypothetical protein
MFKMMLTPMRDPNVNFGVGAYFVGSDHETASSPDSLVTVELRNPLILDASRARQLARKYGTKSGDHLLAQSAAWTLRRDVLKNGHDGIITVSGSALRRRLTVIALDRSTITPALHAA